MFILVKKNLIHETKAESFSAKQYNSMDDALKDFYMHLSNNIADSSVEKFEITILNESLAPCKTERYTRTYETEDTLDI